MRYAHDREAFGPASFHTVVPATPRDSLVYLHDGPEDGITATLRQEPSLHHYLTITRRDPFRQLPFHGFSRWSVRGSSSKLSSEKRQCARLWLTGTRAVG